MNIWIHPTIIIMTKTVSLSKRIKVLLHGGLKMLYLRPYKKEDAETIISWCEDETVFRKWTSDRYNSYPITEKDMNYKYFDCNGDCEEKDNFYPMTAWTLYFTIYRRQS